MNETEKGTIIMVGLISAMCGAVLLFTDFIRRNEKASRPTPGGALQKDPIGIMHN